LTQDKKNKLIYRRQYRNYTSCAPCTKGDHKNECPDNIIRRKQAGTVHLFGWNKEQKYQLLHQVLPVEPYDDGHFGERERWVIPTAGVGKQMAMYDHNFQADHDIAIIGDPRQYGNLKQGLIDKDGQGKVFFKQTGRFTEAGAVFIMRFKTTEEGAIESKDGGEWQPDKSSKQCHVHKYPKMRLGYGSNVGKQSTLVVMQTVRPLGYNEVLDLTDTKKAVLNPPGPQAFNGNLLLRRSEEAGSAIVMVNPGHSVSIMYKPTAIDFEKVASLIATNGYICPNKPQALLCPKILEDITILRNFYNWQTASTGKLASILGVKMKLEGVDSLDMEFMKKVVKYYTEADRHNAAGRMEKSMICATIHKNNTKPMEQCCVLKRGCGDGEGTIDNEFCNPPMPEMKNPVKAF
jgi:hypothetical protein